jgi:hypothetical protein
MQVEVVVVLMETLPLVVVQVELVVLVMVVLTEVLELQEQLIEVAVAEALAVDRMVLLVVQV